MNRLALTLIVMAVLFGGGLLVAIMNDSDDGVAGAQQEGSASDARFDPRFVGDWELLRFVSYAASGDSVVNDYLGRLIYDDFGNMSAIGMPRDLPARARTSPDNPPRAGFAYFSDAEVFSDGRILHHVLGSPTHPSWPGDAQVRFYEFDGERLKLSIREGDTAAGRVTGTLTWQRMQ